MKRLLLAALILVCGVSYFFVSECIAISSVFNAAAGRFVQPLNVQLRDARGFS